MEDKNIYRIVSEWLRENMEEYDPDLGYYTVLSMSICDIDTAIELDQKDYNILPKDNECNGFKSLGATHMCRVLIDASCDLVDGWNIPFYIEDGIFKEIEYHGEPSYIGGELDDGMKWVANRSTKYCIMGED